MIPWLVSRKLWKQDVGIPEAVEAALKWEHVTRIAGKDVAPGRLHVARALLEAGYVENLRQAFTKYLHDGGPVFSTGSESMAEEAVKLICKTGGVAVLAHPWALKNHVGVIRRLKDAGDCYMILCVICILFTLANF